MPPLLYSIYRFSFTFPLYKTLKRKFSERKVYFCRRVKMNKITSESYNLKMAGKNKPCWKEYEMIGTKEKNGKEVPNCVPKKEAKKKEEYEYNPWAVCTSKVGREDKEKYERCVLKVKKKQKD